MWENDSGNYVIMHPAHPDPLVIKMTHKPAWSRTEFSLVLPDTDSPIVRFVHGGHKRPHNDGSKPGEGYLELDTLVSARFDSFYILDVAVGAVLIAAMLEARSNRQQAPAPSTPRSMFSQAQNTTVIPTFAAPPVSAVLPAKLVVKPGDGKKLVKVEKRGNNEVDLEKQKKELDHTTRGLLKGVFWGLRAVVWILGILANALARLIILLSESISGKR
jgi:hypothetical protein